MVSPGRTKAIAAALLVAVALISPLPGAADTSGSSEPGPPAVADYIAMWDQAILPAVTGGGPDSAELIGTITGDRELDARIVQKAEERGYSRQPVPVGALVEVGRWRLQPAAALAWERLQAAAAESGRSLAIVSAHRSLDTQRSLFLGRLGGRTSDAGIDAALATAAPPGFSKHHSGYAVDLAQPGRSRGGFASTSAYEWLAADDFANARAHGWIPSYPADGVEMGPDPEPWEFVWVGVGGQDCAGAGLVGEGFCDVESSPHRDAIRWLHAGGVVVGCGGGRFCVDSPITRGEAASVLWRLYGAPLATVGHGFSDVSPDDHFDAAVGWMLDVGLTTGTGRDTFSPSRPMSASELSALLVRSEGLGIQPVLAGAGRNHAQPSPDPIHHREFISRGEFASILRHRVGVRSHLK